MTLLVTDLQACEDCYVEVANGNRHPELSPGDEEKDHGFTWNMECGVCYSRLGGNRHHVVLLEECPR